MKKQSYISYLLLLLALVYVFVEATGQGDFFIFLSASNDLFQGKNIYRVFYLDGFHYLYSVLFAIVIYPLTFLPLYISKVLWLILNLFFLYRIWKIITSYFDQSQFSQKKIIWFTLLCFVFSLRFIRDNFHLAQMTTFMLYVCLEGVRLIRNDKKVGGALLIAVGINIKLLPIVLLPYLLWRKEFKAFGFCVAFYVLLMLLPMLIIGYEQNSFLLHEWWAIINPTQEQNVIDVSERSFHGLSTLLPTLLMDKVPDMYAMDIKRNIANVSAETVNLILNIVRLILVAFTLYFMRSMPFKKFEGKLKTLWELSYILLLIPLIFPHQQHYAYLFSMPASSYLIYYLFHRKEELSKLFFKTTVAILVVVYLCFNLNLILGEFGLYYQHFKIITYGALLMIPLLVRCKPWEVEIRS